MINKLLQRSTDSHHIDFQCLKCSKRWTQSERDDVFMFCPYCQTKWQDVLSNKKKRYRIEYKKVYSKYVVLLEMFPAYTYKIENLDDLEQNDDNWMILFAFNPSMGAKSINKEIKFTKEDYKDSMCSEAKFRVSFVKFTEELIKYYRNW